MAKMPTQPHPSSRAQPAPFRKTDKTKRGSIVVIYGPEGVGKTTLGAYASQPKFILAPHETGLLTLYKYGLVPEREYAMPESWDELLATVDAVDDCKVLVLDALGGFEQLCHEHVCRVEFDSDWGEKGFIGYQRGPKIAVQTWQKLLQKLETLRNRGISILMLSHQQIRTIQNPLGPDYDRCVPQCNPNTWGITHKWADSVFFVTFLQRLEKTKGDRRMKGIGGNDRVAYAVGTDAWDAKNRFGMPEVFDIPNDPSKSWEAVRAAINGKGVNDA